VTAKVLAVANQKGGVGKTTTALSLGSSLSRMGRKVLVADLDPHACASIHLALYPENLKMTMYDIFMGGRGEAELLWDKAVRRVDGAGFDFAPSSIRMGELEQDLRSRSGGGVLLANRIKPLLERYDYVIFDCPPNAGVVLVNSLVASNLVIIPIQTDFLALHGMRLIFDTIRTLNKALDSPIRYRALATMFDRRAGACRRVLNLLRKKLGERLFDTVIGLDTKFREASARGKVIYEIAPESRGAVEYALLAKEIEA
jgi:chromosome partitioning protein